MNPLKTSSLYSGGESPEEMRAKVYAASSKNCQRSAIFRSGAPPDGEAPLNDRLLTLSFSSEEPVDRWFGDEVLSHAPGAPDFSRLNDGAPLLFNHDPDTILGVVEKAWVKDNRGYATVRFAKTAIGDEILGMVADGVMRNVSFMYQVDQYVEDPNSVDQDGDPQCWVATSWKAFEISLVAIPADQTVGVGRSHSNIRGKSMERNNERAGRSQRYREQGFNAGREDGEREGRQLEADRILAIQTMGERHGMQDLAGRLVRGNASVEEAREAMYNALMSRAPQRPAGSSEDYADIGMHDREIGSYSLLRAINAQITGNWSKAGLERSASVAVANRLGRDSQGFFVPPEVLIRSQWAPRDTRAPYAVGASATGGALVATNVMAGNFIEVLRNSSRVIQAGAMLLTGLVGKVAVPRRTSATGTYWVAESGAVTESEATFDQVLLSPKTIGSLSKMSRLTLMQSTPDIEMLVRNDLAAVIGLGIDLAALSGPGSGNQPTGIVNTAGVGSVVGGTNGAAITLDHLIALESAATTANAPEDAFGYLLNAKTVGSLKTLKSSTGQYLWTNSPPGQRSGTPASFNGYPAYRTNQLRSNLTKGTSVGVCSELVFGCWSELLIGEWGVLEILVNPYDSTGFTTGDVLIRALQTVDIAVKHAPSFAVMSDAL